MYAVSEEHGRKGEKTMKKWMSWLSVPVMGLLLAVAAAPILYWVRLCCPLAWATVLFLLVWVGIPLTLPLCHVVRGERLRITLHLLAEMWLILALALWLGAAAAWVCRLALLQREAWETPCVCVFLAVLLGYLLGGGVNAAVFRTRRRRVKLGLERPLRIALLSDLHLGFFTTKGMLRRAVSAVNRENVDLVLIAGDFFDMDMDSLRHNEECRVLLRSIRSRCGVYGCLGNHDFYLIDRRKDDFLRDSGVRVLLDEAVRVGELTVFGRRDRTDPARRPWQELCPDNVEKLLVLDHNPAAWRDYIGAAKLLLCGHTHGGQTFPLDILQKLLLKYPVYGLKRREGLNICVTSGAGFWGPPVRVGVCNEAVILEVE